jgi:two-component system response regulator HydG
MADGGSLFLDEIGEMSPSVQAKLLRVLENRRFRRVGGTDDHEVDVRVIAATNRELFGMVESGHFRNDLYYRISVIPIHVPALRERPEDVPALVKYFVDGFNAEFRKKVTRVAPEAMDVLAAYRWPGNVRELRNVLERIMLTIESDVVALGDLPASLAGGGAVAVALPGSESESARVADPFRPGYVATLAELEQWGIRRAMEVTGQNKTRAAELLGISRQTLRVKLKEGEGAVDGEAEGIAPPV